MSLKCLNREKNGIKDGNVVMNVLFLTMDEFCSIEFNSLYSDLLRYFRDKGHEVFVVSPDSNIQSQIELFEENHSHIVHVQSDNLTKTGNLIRKGIAQVLIGPEYKKAIVKFFSNVHFDLVLYSTPPITLVNVIRYVKKKDNPRTYLLLKDIFPQNAVDLGMLSYNGLKGFVYRFFRHQERRLYAISDRIGCMSPANVEYVIRHNPDVNPKKVEVCPNSVEVVDKSVDIETRIAIRKNYGIPLNKKVFVYGGNLGKPQGIPFIIESLKKCEKLDSAFFLILGDGTEYHLLEEYVSNEKPRNVKLMKRLPKEYYDNMVGACDVGLIFLDHRFSIPNFPSRLLSYMQAKLPVMACTDPNTDIGKIFVEGRFGWWCESCSADIFEKTVRDVLDTDISTFGTNAYSYLCDNYTVGQSYISIMRGDSM